MDDYKVKTVEFPRTAELPRTKDMPKAKTGDFVPPEIERKPNAFVRFLRALFVNNWQLKLGAIVIAVTVWGVMVFV